MTIWNSNFRRRLEKLEQQMAQVQRIRPVNCNCCPEDPKGIGTAWVISDAKQLEEAMQVRCPAHGFRTLGKLVMIRIFNGKRIAPESVKLAEVRDEYYRRLSEFKKSHSDPDDFGEEF